MMRAELLIADAGKSGIVEMPLAELESILQSLGYEMPDLGCGRTTSDDYARCRLLVRKKVPMPSWRRC